MITRKIVSYDELIKDDGFWETVGGLVHDDCLWEDVIWSLFCSELHQIYAYGKPIGFFTVNRDNSSHMEVHAFINKEDRRYSIAALKEMDEAHKENISTSVWGTHSHVEKILKRMGFKHTGTDKDDVRVGGVVYDIKHFIKEKDNGK